MRRFYNVRYTGRLCGDAAPQFLLPEGQAGPAWHNEALGSTASLALSHPDGEG
jgi:hypothetical protein